MSSVSGNQGQPFEVTVVSCNILKDTEWISRYDPYVCLEYGSSKFRTRTCTDGNKNPTFPEKFTFNLIEGLREIIVNVWNSNTPSLDDFIDTGKIQLHKVLSQGFDDNIWTLCSQTGRYAGEVRLIMHYANANKHGAAAPYSYPPAAAYPATAYPAVHAPPPSAAPYSYPPAAAYPAAYLPNPAAYPPLPAAYTPSPYNAPPQPAAFPTRPYPSATYPPQPHPLPPAAFSQYAPPPSAAPYSYPPAAAYPAAYLPNPAAYPPSPYNAPPQPAAFPPRPYPPATYPPQPHPLPPQGSSYSYLSGTLGVLKVIDLVHLMADMLVYI